MARLTNSILPDSRCSFGSPEVIANGLDLISVWIHLSWVLESSRIILSRPGPEPPGRNVLARTCALLCLEQCRLCQRAVGNVLLQGEWESIHWERPLLSCWRHVVSLLMVEHEAWGAGVQGKELKQWLCQGFCQASYVTLVNLMVMICTFLSSELETNLEKGFLRSLVRASLTHGVLLILVGKGFQEQEVLSR